jgi:hypothetical protein
MTKKFCDKCEQEVFDVNDMYRISVTYLGFSANKTLELCGQCANDWNKEFLGNKKRIWHNL